MEWVFSCMMGVSMEGENCFRIAPMPGGSFTHAAMTYDSLFGSVTVQWDKMEDGYRYHIVIPANCRAKVYLPEKGGSTQRVQRSHGGDLLEKEWVILESGTYDIEK